MGHSKAAKAASRDRILDQAARDVRRDGIAALAIAPLMANAGLTHGAFYSHFASRAELAEAAIDKVLADGEERFRNDARKGDLELLVRRYLSLAHRDSVQDGCSIAATVGDVARSPEFRQLANARIHAYKEAIEQVAPDRDDGWVVLATMLGALLLSRLADDADAEAILAAARKSLAR